MDLCSENLKLHSILNISSCKNFELHDFFPCASKCLTAFLQWKHISYKDVYICSLKKDCNPLSFVKYTQGSRHSLTVSCTNMRELDLKSCLKFQYVYLVNYLFAHLLEGSFIKQRIGETNCLTEKARHVRKKVPMNQSCLLHELNWEHVCIHSIYEDRKLLALVHLIHSWLVWAEMECIV